jgi:hypothetical protein
MKRHPQIKGFAIIAILLGFYFFASPYQTCLRDNTEKIIKNGGMKIVSGEFFGKLFAFHPEMLHLITVFCIHN